jgi:hypothetical protein
MEKKFRKTFETMEGLCRVMHVTDLKKPNTGKDYDNENCVRYALPPNNSHTLLLESIRFYFILQKVCELVCFFVCLFVFLSSSTLLHIFISELDSTPLQCIFTDAV